MEVKPENQARDRRTLSPAQLDRILTLLKENGKTLSDLRQYLTTFLNIDSIAEIERGEFEEVLAWIEGRVYVGA